MRIQPLAGADRLGSASNVGNETGPMCGASKLWMRPISFVALQKIASEIYYSFPDGFTAGELNRLIQEKRLLSIGRDRKPSITTLFHYRNVLLKLGVIVRYDRRLGVAVERPGIQELVREEPREERLSPHARAAYRSLVFANADCREVFLDLFMPGGGVYGFEDFLRRATYVTWRQATRGGRRSVVIDNPSTGRRCVLSRPSQIQAVFFGLRYWARNELLFVDEFFREDVGAILYPVKEMLEEDEGEIRDELRRRVAQGSEWVTFSVRDLAFDLCVGRRWPLRSLFAAVRRLMHSCPGHVTLIPTSRGFASIGSRGHGREEFELRGYLRDSDGRLVSHVRIHRDVGNASRG
jgi:hypothetical protein